MATQQVVCRIHEISVWIRSAETQLLFHFKRAGVLPKASNAHFHFIHGSAVSFR